jgi:hypothetical protein
MRLKAGATRTLSMRVKFDAPAADGDYLLLASATGGAVNAAKSLLPSTAAVRLERPVARLAALIDPADVASILRWGASPELDLPLRNHGNVNARGRVGLELLLSPDGTLDAGIPLATIDGSRVDLRPDGSSPLRLKFNPADGLPALTPGASYTLFVRLASTDLPDSGNALGDVLASIPFTVPAV